MLSILKKINPDFTASGVATVIAVFAIMIALSSDSTPCASANAGCTVGQDPTFTGDIAIQSDTIYNATIGHNLSAPGVFNLVQPGYNHTGNLAVIDSANDLNIGGAVVLGSSLTSTLGSLRFDSDQVQVYNSTGSWVGVGGSPTDDIGQVTSDSGSFTAVSQQDNINIVGSGSISTAVVGDTLTISSSGGGTPLAVYGYVTSGYTPTGSGTEVIRLETEYYDTGSCFTFNGSPNYTITYTCSETKMFQEFIMVQVNAGSNARMGMVGEVNGIFLNEFLNGGSSVTQNSKAGFISVCLNQNDYLEVRVNSNGQTVEGGFGYSQFQLNEIQGVDVSGGCTDGRLD